MPSHSSKKALRQTQLSQATKDLTPLKPKLKIPRLELKIKGKRVNVWIILIALFIPFVLLNLYLFWDLPDPANLTKNPAQASTKLLDRQGRLIYEIYSDERRTPIKLDTLPKYVSLATVASEDQDFYKHGGFDIRGISRAFVNTFFKRNLQGGSTITQQLVKLALLQDQSRTPRRKAREFVLSIAVEAKYSKDQILELYLNQVPYGGTAYGLESAAQTYFGKKSSDLTLAESALLAGLPNAPSLYSPFGSRPELAKNRQQYVLTRMLESGYITNEEFEQAKAEQLNYITPSTLKAPHFSLWVKDLLISKYGLQTVEKGGLIVTTSLDLDLQGLAQQEVASEVAKLKKENVGNGAALVTHPKTGEILAMVGSKDYYDTAQDGNVNVVLAHRQPGSSIKPITYALGIERKLFTAGSLLADKPTCFGIPDQKPYCPENYDNQFHGPTHVRFALGNSYNIPAVKAFVLNGLNDFVASSSAFGFTTFKDPKQYGPSLTLGGGEVSMLDLATAYGVLANAGQKVLPNPLLQVKDRNGQILESVSARELTSSTEIEKYQKSAPYSYFQIDGKYFTSLPPANTRVISQGTAFIISHILYDNGARSATFGSSSFLNVPNHPEVSVKTGTTNDKRDNWTVGYNPDILVAVWVGNNDNATMSRVASGVTGASPIWNKIIRAALKNYPQNWPSQPADVTGTLICNYSGLKAPDNPDPTSCPTRYEYFLTGTVPPTQNDNLRRDIPIYRPTQAPATAKQLIENPGEIEMQNHMVAFDSLGTMLCLDCAGGYGEADTLKLDDKGKVILPK